MRSFGPSWIGRTLGGRYQIEAILGRGGMSSVYRATDPNLQRKVAVKIIHQHLSDNSEFIQRFEQEAALVARLRHTNIVQVHDFNHEGDVYYMVLEFVSGETLAKRLETLNSVDLRLPVTDTVRILVAICGAVDYAHQRRLIHRDLKPANVMINLLGEPVLMDFGIAKILGGQSHTTTGAAMGTAAYISPEQVRGEKIDHRADIYALGIMMYEMLSGETPFHSDSTYQIMLQHVNEPVPDIRQIDAGVPDSLVMIVDKALAKDPDQRYQTAAEIAAALRAFQHQLQEPTDTPTAPSERSPNFHGVEKLESEASPPLLSQRYGHRFWLGVGAALIMLTLATGGFWFIARGFLDESALNVNTTVATPSGLASGLVVTPTQSLSATATATLLPSATATSTSIPTSTPSPTALATATSTVTGPLTPVQHIATARQPSSIFAAPDASSEEVAVVDVGEQVRVEGRSERGSWLFVVNDEFTQGFVFAQRFDWTGDFDALPPVTPAAVGDNSDR